MATGFMSPVALLLQAFTDQGIIGAGYKIQTYVAGSTTPVITYTDSTLTVQNSNPIVLSTTGRLPASIWAPPGTVIKIVFQDPTGAPVPNGTIDNIPLLNDVTSSLFPITASEIAAGVTIQNFVYPALNILRYRATNATDDQAAWEAMLSVMNVIGEPGSIPQRATNYNLTTTKTIAAMTAPFRLYGVGKPIIQYSGSQTEYMLLVSDTNGFDVDIRDLTFDVQTKACMPLRFNNPSPSMAAGNIGHARFRNMSCLNPYLATGRTQVACGLLIQGGFQSVQLDDCDVINVNRDTGAGTAGVKGCAGWVVTFTDINSYVQRLIVNGGTIDTITNKEATGTAADVDCDGIIFSCPTATQNGGLHVPVLYLVDGVTFINCKGRNVKSQIDGFNLVTGCKVVRNLEEAINNAREFDFQRGGGAVVDCDLFYYPTAGGGTTLGTSHSVGIYSPDQLAITPDNFDGGYQIRNVTIYNAIPSATDSLPYFCLLTNDDDTRKLCGISLKDCNVIGGSVGRWLRITNTADSNLHISVDGCSASNLLTSLIQIDVSVGTSAKVMAANNRHLGSGTPVVLELADNSEPFVSGHSNFGFVVNYLPTSTANTLGAQLRPGSIGGDAANGHAIVQPLTVILADDASYAFPACGTFGVGFITSTFGDSVQVVFGHDTNSFVQISPVSADVTIGTTTNPDIDGDLNIWIPASGQINIKNRLGSQRQFTLFHFGG